jgi:hypothetical protein
VEARLSGPFRNSNGRELKAGMHLEVDHVRPRHMYLQCNHCKQLGHTKRYCPQLQSSNARELARHRKGDEICLGVSGIPQVLVTTIEQREPVEVVNAASDSGTSRSWVLDSDATAQNTKDAI